LISVLSEGEDARHFSPQKISDRFLLRFDFCGAPSGIVQQHCVDGVVAHTLDLALPSRMVRLGSTSATSSAISPLVEALS
jgi:hypothetical protein